MKFKKLTNRLIKSSVLNILIILISTLLYIPVDAQNLLKAHKQESYMPKQSHFKAYSFQVDGECYIGVQGCNINTPVEFYSTVHGGKMLRRSNTNTKGAYYTTFNSEEMPAFVLNKKSNKPRARGFVQFFDQHEFVMQNFHLERLKNTFNLSFDAVADNEEEISYKVFSENNDGEITLLKELDASKNKEWEYIVFDFPFSIKTNYTLKVYNGEKERYSRSLYISDPENIYSVYPTLVNNSINIDFLKEVQSVNYSITDVNGKQIINGTFNNQFNELELSHISQGTYILHVDFNNQKINGTQFFKR